MNNDYYKEYYNLERNNWYFIVRYQIIDFFLRKYLTLNDDLKILNIGAATGRSSEILMKYGSVKSVEYDFDCFNFTKEVLKIDIVQGSITSLPFQDESFDLVCAFDVLEHIENDQKGANEMKRVCKKHGIIFITVPMYMALWGQHDEVNQHYRRYNKREVFKLFNDLTKIYSTNFNSILFPLIYIYRIIKNTFKIHNNKGSGSDFSIFQGKGLINNILFLIFKFEAISLRFIKYPFGVSLIFITRK